MNCKSAQNLFSAYLDQEIPGDQCLSIQRHLDTCLDCQLELAGIKAVRDLARSSEEPEIPVGFEERLVSQFHAQKNAPRRERVIHLSFAMAAAFAATALITTLSRSSIKPDGGNIVRGTGQTVSQQIRQDQIYASQDSLAGMSVASPASYEGR